MMPIRYFETNDQLKRIINYVFNNVEENSLIWFQENKGLLILKKHKKVVTVKLISSDYLVFPKISLNNFKSFLMKKRIVKKAQNNVLLFHYGEKVVNENISKRMRLNEIKDEYSKIIDETNIIFNSKSFINQFVTYYNDVLFCYDYYYFSFWNVIISKGELLQIIKNNITYSRSLHIGVINYEITNRNIKKDICHEYNRNYISFKIKVKEIINILSFTKTNMLV